MISAPICLRVKGPFACFTRPEFHVERVSYPVITPSAARGILEAILMKPVEKPESAKRHDKTGFRWRVKKIGVVEKGVFFSVLRNEIQKEPITAEPYDIFSERTQRHSLILKGRWDGKLFRELEYLIVAVIDVADGTEGQQTHSLLRKYEDMFHRYASEGRCYYQPFLGCREFSLSSWELASEAEPSSDINDDFGYVFHDFDYRALWDKWPSVCDAPRPDYEESEGKRRIIRRDAQPIQLPKLHAKAEKGWIVVEP